MTVQSDVDIAWRKNARCIGMFEVSEARGASEVAQAKAVCAQCPVIQECLIVALQEEAGRASRFGVRGGQGPKGRGALAPFLGLLQADLGRPVS